MKKIYDEFTALQISRQRKYQLRMKKRGCCIICGVASIANGYCDRHIIAYAKMQMKYRGGCHRKKGKWLGDPPN